MKPRKFPTGIICWSLILFDKLEIEQKEIGRGGP